MLALIQHGVLLIGTAIGAITDANTGYIYDWITYPMIALGLILSVLQGQTTNILIGVTLFAGTYLIYKTGKLGGGDVKLFTAIALLNPTNDYPFLLTILFFSAASAMIFYGTYYTLKYYRKGIRYEENKQGITKALIFAGIIILYFATLGTLGLMRLDTGILIMLPLLFGLVFVGLQKGITKHFFQVKLPLKKLEDDEVLAEEGNSATVHKLLHGKKLIGETELALLKKKGITSLTVLRNLPPFGPFILIGTLGATFWPTLFLTLLL